MHFVYYVKVHSIVVLSIYHSLFWEAQQQYFHEEQQHSGRTNRRKQQVSSLKMKKRGHMPPCSPLFDGHVSGRHHVAHLVSLLGLKQACCMCAAVWVCVCGWGPTHTPGETRCCPGCYHSGVRQLCEHEQTSTHRGERKSITGHQVHKCEHGSHRGLI